MPLTLSDVLSSATVAQWEAQILSYATSLGLTATSWQPGGVARTIIAVMANALAQADAVTTGIAAGGYLDTAAAVTDEYGPGWLDLVAQYVFGVTRTAATQGTSSVVIVNTGAAIGPIPAGAYHLQAASGNTYRNSGVITLATGSTTVAITCDQFGEVDSVGTALTPITTYPGVTPGTMVTTATGTPAETNAALVARCRDKVGALAPKLGNASSYRYFALTTTEPGYPLPATPITRVSVDADTYTGAVSVYLASASGIVTAPNVALMQTYLDDVATPDSASMTCFSASPVTVNFAMQVYCPQSYASQVSADVTAAWNAYIAALPIGGELLEGGGGYGVSYNGVEDYIARAVPYIRTQTTQLNGLASSVIMTVVPPFNDVAVSGTITVTRAGA